VWFRPKGRRAAAKRPPPLRHPGEGHVHPRLPADAVVAALPPGRHGGRPASTVSVERTAPPASAAAGRATAATSPPPVNRHTPWSSPLGRRTGGVAGGA